MAATATHNEHVVEVTDMGQFDAFMKGLTRQVEAMMGRNLVPVVLCPPQIRRALRNLLQRSMPYVAVIGVNEVPATQPVRSFATLQSAA